MGLTFSVAQHYSQELCSFIILLIQAFLMPVRYSI